jgi:hypothetical protein
MLALRNGAKSLRSDVSTPCWVETGEAGRPAKSIAKIATPRLLLDESKSVVIFNEKWYADNSNLTT